MKLYDWKIASKGLALVAIPVATNLIFLTLLGILLHQSEVETEHEARSKQIHSTTNSLGRCFFQGVSIVSTMFLVKNEAAASQFAALAQENTGLMDTLTSLVHGNEEEEAAVTKYKATNARAFELLSTLAEATHDANPTTFLRVEGIKEELESVINSVIADTGELDRVVVEQDRQHHSVGASVWREGMAGLIYTGFAISIVLSIVLAHFFSREITTRLQQVIENTQRLPKNEPLAPPMPGKDEITILDTTFHEMVRALKHAEQLRRDFVAMLTHDLRSPLTSINITLEQLGETQPTANRAQREVERMITMISDLLDMEQVETGRLSLSKEIVHVNAVAERAIESVADLAKLKGVTIIRDLQVCEAFADGLRLQRVIINLIANAVRYAPSQTEIVASCREVEQGILVSITDQGPGISPEQQAQLFQKYQQLDRPTDRGGSGLGLAICKAVVESHGGEIGVVSQVGQGSTFWFRIPLSTPQDSG